MSDKKIQMKLKPKEGRRINHNYTFTAGIYGENFEGLPINLHLHPVPCHPVTTFGRENHPQVVGCNLLIVSKIIIPSNEDFHVCSPNDVSQVCSPRQPGEAPRLRWSHAACI